MIIRAIRDRLPLRWWTCNVYKYQSICRKLIFWTAMMKTAIYACFALLIVLNEVNSQITDSCLRCICKVEGCDSQIGKCRDDARSPSCGPYQIKKPYWIDCGKPGKDYETCTKSKDCSETCVRAYVKKYGASCAKGRTPTCQDYARVHNGGPTGCKKSATLDYWKKMQKCLG